MGRTRRSARKRTYLKRKHIRRSVQKMSRKRTRKRRNTRRATKRIKKRGGMLGLQGPPRRLTPAELKQKLETALRDVRQLGSTPWENYKDAGNPPKESMPKLLKNDPKEIMKFSKKAVEDALKIVNEWETIYDQENLDEEGKNSDPAYQTLMRQKAALEKKSAEFESARKNEDLFRTWLEELADL